MPEPRNLPAVPDPADPAVRDGAGRDTHYEIALDDVAPAGPPALVDPPVRREVARLPVIPASLATKDARRATVARLAGRCSGWGRAWDGSSSGGGSPSSTGCGPRRSRRVTRRRG